MMFFYTSSHKYDLFIRGLPSYNQWAKSPKKQSEGVRFCIVKNTLLQTAFSAILPSYKNKR